MKLPIWSRLIAIILIWIPALLFAGWILSQRFPLDGIAKFNFAFDGRSPWFNPFQPGERVTSPGQQPEGWIGQRILQEPVYGSARVPGAYDTVGISFDIRTTRQPLAELGILRDEASFAFEVKPLWSEALSRGWHPVALGDKRGFVRDGLADSELLANNFEKLLVWQATTSEPILSDSAGTWKSFDISLRGGHDFHVVPADGVIEYKFLIQDVNRSRDPKNTAAFRLTHGDDILYTESVSVSGVIDTRMSEPVEKTIRVSDLAPGVYKLSFVADDDFFIRSISTRSKRWVIGPRLYVGDTVGYRATSTPLAVYTNSIHTVVDTFHNEGMQTVSLGNASLKIDKTHTPFVLSRSASEQSGWKTLSAGKGNVRVIGDGFFAFDQSAAFLPRPRRLTADTNPVAEGITAVLTPYEKPTDLGSDWWRVSADFTLPRAPDDLKFSLALPGVVSRSGAFDIRAATITYRRPALSIPQLMVTLRREASAILSRLW
ncbi:hypothetical protein IPH19_01175 [Candidatus Uhrbacteria bacterium]|nr:MAG: hypothetical protein IPH19_01175 [Candidatus Uhrbacteria bacterium]